MKIGIFTAMEEEAYSFLQRGATKLAVGGFDVYTLQMAGQQVFLCCPPSIGEIAASAACQLLISDFHVDVILNFGVVGALTEKTAVSTLVLVGDVVHYDMDLSQIDHLSIGRYCCFDDVAVPCDEKLIGCALSRKQMPVVRCASADKFVANPEKKNALWRNFGAEICDMESAGILFTCRFNRIPCLLVKCVSDSLTGGSGEYAQNAERVARDFFALAEQIVEEISSQQN